MDRRDYLRALAAAGAAGVAGCAGAPGGSGNGTRTGTPRPLSERLPVPRSELDRGARRDAIPAIVDPVFAEDWSGLAVEHYDARSSQRVESAPRLADDDAVIGVAAGGVARAYPLRVLNWHEVVNDTFPAGSEGTTDGDAPLLVTYCPLCATGVVADRLVGGEATTFGVSGLLYRSNLVMYDAATHSKWSQVHALAIRGPETGTRLELRAAARTTWGEWRSDHPGTEVLLPPPASSTVAGRDATRNYSVDPYADYADSDEVGISRQSGVDGRLHPKTTVLGVHHGDAATAYPLPAVREAGGLVRDAVGDLPVVVASTPDDGLVGYVRRVDGSTVRFRRPGRDRLTAAGSTWNLTSGEAVDGPHEGTTLSRANDRSPMFWFSWADTFPGTAIYGDGGTATDS